MKIPTNYVIVSKGTKPEGEGIRTVLAFAYDDNNILRVATPNQEGLYRKRNNMGMRAKDFDWGNAAVASSDKYIAAVTRAISNNN